MLEVVVVELVELLVVEGSPQHERWGVMLANVWERRRIPEDAWLLLLLFSLSLIRFGVGSDKIGFNVRFMDSKCFKSFGIILMSLLFVIVVDDIVRSESAMVVGSRCSLGHAALQNPIGANNRDDKNNNNNNNHVVLNQMTKP